MNKELFKKLKNMTAAEVYAAVYSDPLTGIQNRLAWDEVYANPARYGCVAIVDLDSLKYINDNIGHAEGNAYIKHLATLLASTFGEDNVALLGGDEFGIMCDTPRRAQSALNGLRFLFPGFTYGIGDCLDSADLSLIAAKNERERTGERAGRGECPPWLGDGSDRLEAC